MPPPGTARSRSASLVVAVLALAAAALYLVRRPDSPPPAVPEPPPAPATFAGSSACRSCHAGAYELWRGSDHERAMAEASAATVLGDFDDAFFEHRGVRSKFYRRDGRFFVFTEGPGGVMGEFEIAYTFGVRPLQQVLVPLPGGRLQALQIAWDTTRGRWFHLQPDEKVPPSDWLHWTRNGQNWNGMCAECHSTGLEKNFDDERSTYETTWSEISVGCEACHGPGSRHLAWAAQAPESRGGSADRGLVVATRGATSERRVESCAACHSRRAELGDYDHVAPRLLDQMLPSTLDEGLYFPDGQQQDEVYTYGSFLQSRMYAKGLSCTDCHDPHRAKLRADGNAACVRCHNPAGAALREGIDGSGLRQKAYDSPAHHFHRAGGPGSACVDCHAPPRAYMLVDPRHDHSFRIPRPDLSVATGSPDACTTCHEGRTPEWAAASVARWYGPSRRREHHYGETFAAARAHRPEAGEALRALAIDPAKPGIVRATAIGLLRGYPGSETDRVVGAALAERDPMLRAEAARSFAPPDARAQAVALAPLLTDPVRGVRLLAAAAIAESSLEALGPERRAAFDGALRDYENAMRRTLDFASSGLNLGNLYTRLVRSADAERAYRRALDVDARFVPAALNLAVLLSGEGRHEEAERTLRDALAAGGESSDIGYALALLLAETGRPEEAADRLRKVVAEAPADARASYNLGLLLVQLGQIDAARATFERALGLDPDNFDLLFALADLELRSGRAKRALTLADRMMALRPLDTTAARLRAAAERAAAGGEAR